MVCARSLVEALFVGIIMQEIGNGQTEELHKDSSASLGLTQGAELSKQHRVRQGCAKLNKVKRRTNPPELCTTYPTRNEITRHVCAVGFRIINDNGTGRWNKRRESEHPRAECGLRDVDASSVTTYRPITSPLACCFFEKGGTPLDLSAKQFAASESLTDVFQQNVPSHHVQPSKKRCSSFESLQCSHACQETAMCGDLAKKECPEFGHSL